MGKKNWENGPQQPEDTIGTKLIIFDPFISPLCPKGGNGHAEMPGNSAGNWKANGNLPLARITMKGASGNQGAWRGRKRAETSFH